MKIELQNVSYGYQTDTEPNHLVLHDISLTIQQGEFIGIIGTTGSGKSTLVKHLNGLLKATRGDVLCDGQSIYQKKYPRRQLRQKVGLVFQYPEHQLFAKTVLEDVAFGPRNMGCTLVQAQQYARDVLKQMGISEELFEASPHELSGGQMRRVAIAGILAMQPKMLVLDEPTAGLDPQAKKQLLEQLKKLNGQGITILLVSHSMEDVADYAQRVIVLKEGKICMDGTPEQIFSQVEPLQRLGMETHPICHLLWQLKQRNIPIETICCNQKQAAAQILCAVAKRGREEQ